MSSHHVENAELAGWRLLLQVRTQVLNDELAGVFQRWYPAFVAPTGSAEMEELIA